MSQPHDFPFDITDVAELLHLRIRRPSPQGLYVDCPICNDKRGKMHINTQTDTWRCNYCDESGGIVQVKKRCFKAKLAAFLGQKLNSPIMDCLFHIGRKLVLQYFLLS